MNPFNGLMVQILNQMGLKEKIPIEPHEVFAEKFIQAFWQDLTPEGKAEYKPFYPYIQDIFFDICKSKNRITRMKNLIDEYLKE